MATNLKQMRTSITCVMFALTLSHANAQRIPFATREDEAEFNKIQSSIAQKKNHVYVIEDLLLDLKETPLKVVYVGASRYGVLDNFISIERPKSFDPSEILKSLNHSELISRIESEGLSQFVVSKSARELLAHPSLTQKQMEFMLPEGDMFSTFIWVSKRFKVPLFITPGTIILMKKIHVEARSYKDLTIVDVYRDLLKLAQNVSWGITICEAPNKKIGDIAITSY